MISGVEKVQALRFLYWKGTCLETRDEPNGLFRLSKKVLSLRHEHPSSLLGLPKKILVMLSTCCATSSSFVWSDHFLVDGMELSSNHTGSCYRWSEKSLSVCVWDIEDKKIEDKAGKLTTVQNAIFLGNIKESPSPNQITCEHISRERKRKYFVHFSIYRIMGYFLSLLTSSCAIQHYTMTFYL